MNAFQPLLLVTLTLGCLVGAAPGPLKQVVPKFDFAQGIADVRCPANDNPMSPTLLSVPGDCSRFLKCYQGLAFAISCPAGQEYGAAIQRCDYPVFARCSQGYVQPQPAALPSDAGAPLAQPVRAEFTYNAGVLDLRCPKSDDPFRPTHLPHATDCRKFLKCFDGRAYTIDCPPGQEFGARINRCDYPQFAQCSMQRARKSMRKAAAPPVYDDDYYYDYYDTPGADVPLDSAEWTPEQREMIAGLPDSRCPEKDDPAEPIHFTHPRECGKFYKCYSGRVFLINCPIGQHWSVRYDRCDYPKVAKCTIRGS